MDENLVYFNELSFQQKKINYDILKNLALLQKEIQKNNFSLCRCSKEVYVEFLELVKTIPGYTPKFSQLILSFFRPPYVKGGISITTKYKITYNKQQCEGFLWALINNTFSISLLTDAQWNTNEIEVVDDGIKTKVLHASKPEHIIDNPLYKTMFVKKLNLDFKNLQAKKYVQQISCSFELRPKEPTNHVPHIHIFDKEGNDFPVAIEDGRLLAEPTGLKTQKVEHLVTKEIKQWIFSNKKYLLQFWYYFFPNENKKNNE